MGVLQPLSPWSSPLTQIPFPPLPPIPSPSLPLSSPLPVPASPPASLIRSLGYRATLLAEIRGPIYFTFSTITIRLPSDPTIRDTIKYVEEERVTFATGTLTNDALSWWNAYAQPIGIEQANKITWTELKWLLTNKYCTQTEVKKMEDEFYDLTVKGNDLKTYVRRFQELAALCPNMMPNNEKLLEAFIRGLPRSTKGNVTALKPQTLEEATNIAQRLMDQILKHNSIQEANDRKQKFEDRRNTINNNNYANNSYNSDYPNNLDNNNHPNNHNDNLNHDHYPQQNGRQETLKTYAVSPTKYTRPPKKYLGILPLCTRCTLHHIGPCTIKCQNCNKIGHLTRNYEN
ncbi:reverse transcriptase domain-containing protein [Tanacetum coccineum]